AFAKQDRRSVPHENDSYGPRYRVYARRARNSAARRDRNSERIGAVMLWKRLLELRLFRTAWETLQEVKLFRTLRFRLAATFLLLLTGVLAIMGFVGTTTLSTVIANQIEDELKEQLGALKGWIEFEGDSGEPYWFVDHSDPEEEAEVSKLNAVYIIADDQGQPHKGSSGPAWRQLSNRKTILAEMAQMQVTRQPIIKTIRGTDKAQYKIISSTLRDDKHARTWYIAEGLSLVDDQKVLRRFR